MAISKAKVAVVVSGAAALAVLFTMQNQKEDVQVSEPEPVETLTDSQRCVKEIFASMEARHDELKYMPAEQRAEEVAGIMKSSPSCIAYHEQVHECMETNPTGSLVLCVNP